jgi:hypothetical protein
MRPGSGLGDGHGKALSARVAQRFNFHHPRDDWVSLLVITHDLKLPVAEKYAKKIKIKIKNKNRRKLCKRL